MARTVQAYGRSQPRATQRASQPTQTPRERQESGDEEEEEEQQDSEEEEERGGGDSVSLKTWTKQ